MKNTHTNNASKNLLDTFRREYLEKMLTAYPQYCFEHDFIERCSYLSEDKNTRLYLLSTFLPEEKNILSKAYELYRQYADCNISYNNILDLVIRKVDSLIQNGNLECHSLSIRDDNLYAGNKKIIEKEAA